mgnify:CR=1 FL=1
MPRKLCRVRFGVGVEVGLWIGLWIGLWVGVGVEVGLGVGLELFAHLLDCDGEGDHVPQHRGVELEVELRGVARHVERVRGEADPGRAELLVPEVGLVGAEGEEEAEHALSKKARLARVSSRPAWGLLVWGSRPAWLTPSSECTIGGAHSWYRKEARVMQLAHSVCAISIGSTRRATWKGSLLELRMGCSTISHCG